MISGTVKSRQHESGLSLMEMLLVVALLSGIMLVLTLLLQNFMRKEHMASVAGQLAIVQKAVNESVSSIEQFNALYNHAEANGGVVEISILAPNNPNRTVNYAPTGNVSLEMGGAGFAASNIINAGFNPSNPSNFTLFRDTLPIRASSYTAGIDGPQANDRREVRLTVVARIVGASPKAMEIMIASIDRVSEEDMRAIMAHMDGHGGYVSEIATDTAAGSACRNAAQCALTARSAHGNWSSQLTAFAGTRWYTIASGAPASAANGGYLVSYSYINEKMLTGDYLYRVAVPGSPELNRMHTGLNMAGNNIVGADNVEISNTSSSPALLVRNSVYAQGSVFVGNNLNVTGDLVSDDDIMAGEIVLAPSYDTTTIIPPAHGNIIVGGDFQSQNMNVSNHVSTRNDARIRQLTVPQISAAGNMQAGTVDSTAVGGGVIAQSLSVAGGAVNVDSGLVAARINAQDVSAPTAGIVQGQMGGGLTVQNRLSIADHKLSVTGNVTVDNLVACNSGC